MVSRYVDLRKRLEFDQRRGALEDIHFVDDRNEILVEIVGEAIDEDGGWYPSARRSEPTSASRASL